MATLKTIQNGNMFKIMAKKFFKYFVFTNHTNSSYQFVGLSTFNIRFRYVYTENFLD